MKTASILLAFAVVVALPVAAAAGGEFVSPVSAMANSWDGYYSSPIMAIDGSHDTHWTSGYSPENETSRWIYFQLTGETNGGPGEFIPVNGVEVTVDENYLPIRVSVEAETLHRYILFPTLRTIVSNVTVTNETAPDGKFFLPFDTVDASFLKFIVTPLSKSDTYGHYTTMSEVRVSVE